MAYQQPQMPQDPMGQGGMPPEMPGQGGMPPAPVSPPQEPQGDFALEALLQQINIAEKVSDEELVKIGLSAKKGYEIDLASRIDWERKYEEWLKLAMQVKETKSYPWPGASNVKYPILSTAAMQFAARAYPSLIPANSRVVNYRVIGDDKGGQKAAKAERVSKFMSWQVLESMTDWEEDMDKLLLMLPIIGCAFKKTYWDGKFKKPSSKLVHAKDLVINYWAESVDKCERKTQQYYYTKRELEEKFRRDEYLEVKLPDPAADQLKTEDKLTGLMAGETDESTPYLVLEQHTFYDLDDDGYAEPYIITILYQTGEVLRISARWDSDGVKKDSSGKIVCIVPVEYYTKYSFIPNPDGGFYDIGFGLLLGPLNEAVNTILNQLVDSGHMATLGGGWISKGLRIKQGTHSFKPNEWKQVDATLDDIKKGIFPLPVREPSNVLFQLLGSLISSSKELASVAEIFTGKMPGQNTPAYTTRETVEQGMKVFTAIYKRCYRSLASEFKKLYRLNQVYFQEIPYAQVIDGPANEADFSGSSDDIVPAADPQAISMTDKVAKAQSLLQLLQLGLDRAQVVQRVLEAMEVPNYQELMQKQQQPPPPPEVQKAQMEMKMMQEEHQLKMKELEQENQFKVKEMQMKLQFEQEKMNLERQKLGLAKQEMQFDLQIMAQQAKLKQADTQQKMVMANVTTQQKMQQADQAHRQELEQGAAAHKQDMQQKREVLTLKKKEKTSGGAS